MNQSDVLLTELQTWPDPLVDLLRQYSTAAIAKAFGLPKKAVASILEDTADPQLACSFRAAQFYADHWREMTPWGGRRAASRPDRAHLIAYIKRQNVKLYADTLLSADVRQLSKLLGDG